MADRGPVIADLSIAYQEADGITQITGTGLFIGTPAFMAPELIRGEGGDQRSDIYSLGLLLYYCLAGKLPWEDLSGIDAVMRAVLFERLDMSGLGISPALRAAMEKATAAAPVDRFPDGDAFGDALRATPEWKEFHTGPKPARSATTRVRVPKSPI